MGLGDLILSAGQFVVREAGLFAAVGFLFLGLGDVAVDLVWIGLRLGGRMRAPDVPPATRPGPLAVFVPAWDEGAVIGAMLDHARTAFGAADHVVYVGCYPNDPATAAAVWRADHARIRLVIGPRPGPTSKADCLNMLWARMVADERAEGRRFKAVVLHDAEDVVHSAELPLFDALTERFDLVQLPVVPLIDPERSAVRAVYADEFAESHGKELVVRQAIGASLPSAGVGCAISRDALAALAEADGRPFDPASLTEDYELGLRLKALGRSAAFVRMKHAGGRAVVATREYFPATLEAAVAQRSRWVAGIALAGWDRLGWGGGLAERWMRLRDRQAPLAALVLAAGYLALLLYALLLPSGRQPGPFSPLFLALAAINSLLLLWRLAMRFGFVAATYGWREGVRSLPRVVVSNIVSMLAARRALARYLRLLRTGSVAWGKTAHAFPDELPAE